MAAARERVPLPVLPLRTDRQAGLERDGWSRRFVATPPRLAEVVALYQSLGLDVRVEPLDACELDDDCADCLTAGPVPCVIYTRGRT
jgi:hypothetical protein